MAETEADPPGRRRWRWLLGLALPIGAAVVVLALSTRGGTTNQICLTYATQDAIYVHVDEPHDPLMVCVREACSPPAAVDPRWTGTLADGPVEVIVRSVSGAEIARTTTTPVRAAPPDECHQAPLRISLELTPARLLVAA